ncbi:MAG: helix-hairpin-helix domain-containing protein [Sedimentisphaerales bacterium]
MIIENERIKKMINIQESPISYLGRLISGLSIPRVGKQTAWILAEHFDSIRPLMKANLMELEGIDGIGESIAEKIWEYFQDNRNIKEINELTVMGIAY